MKAVKIALILCLAAISASHGWSQAINDPGKYEVLGLKLGLTAKEAESAITARFHISPGQRGYGISQGVPAFVPGRPFVSGIYVQVGEVKLELDFTETVSGEGKGPSPAIIPARPRRPPISHLIA